jgi:CheY-like chemotaxis protein
VKPLRVFVVDDDQDFAESLALLIEGRGYEVELAFSGEEAIDKFRQQDFDITFMDVKLPGKDGVESFLEIRQFKPSARVVMMTGYSVEQLLEQAVEQGAWGVLNKPLDIERMLNMIEGIKPDDILIVDDDPDFVESIKNLLLKAVERLSHTEKE